jgi:hypothetical protein
MLRKAGFWLPWMDVDCGGGLLLVCTLGSLSVARINVGARRSSAVVGDFRRDFHPRPRDLRDPLCSVM